MNSSIFSSENWKHFLRQSRSRHQYHLVVVVCLVGMVLVSRGILAGLEPPDRRRPRFAFDDLPTAEVLVLGNSQLQRILPDELSLKTINSAEGAADYSVQDAVLRSLAPRMPRLRHVIVGLDNIPLHLAAIEERHGDYSDIMSLGVPWWRIPDVGPVDRLTYSIATSRFLKPFFRGPKLDYPGLESLIHSMLEPRSDSNESALSPGPAPDSPSAQPRVLRAGLLSFDLAYPRLTFPIGLLPVTSAVADASTTPAQVDSTTPIPETPASAPRPPQYPIRPDEGHLKIRGYIRKFESKDHFEANFRAFTRIVSYCDARNLNLIFVRVPTSRSFWSNRPAQWDRELEMLKAAAASILHPKPLIVLDEESRYNYPDSYFNDPNHMTQAAAMEYTRRLNERLLAIDERLDATGYQTASTQADAPEQTDVTTHIERNGQELLLNPEFAFWRGGEPVSWHSSPRKDLVNRVDKLNGEHCVELAPGPQGSRSSLYQLVSIAESRGAPVELQIDVLAHEPGRVTVSVAFFSENQEFAARVVNSDHPGDGQWHRLHVKAVIPDEKIDLIKVIIQQREGAGRSCLFKRASLKLF